MRGLRRYVVTVYDAADDGRVIATVDVEAGGARRAADETAADYWSAGTVVAWNVDDEKDSFTVRRGVA